MEQAYYNEMLENLHKYEEKLNGKTIFLFGHCEATLALIDLLIDNDFRPIAILDNSENKHGKEYRGISVKEPSVVLDHEDVDTVVLIVTRFYESMSSTLRNLGFSGDVIKLVDYNTYAEYSLSEETQKRKRERVDHGLQMLEDLKNKYRNSLLVFCPFNALGDIYFCMSYLPEYLKKRGTDKFAIIVPSKSCGTVAGVFGAENVEIYQQKELDAVIQAAIYTKDNYSFIAHQDRPYVVNLHKALKIRPITLEKIYCCGVFGLPEHSEPSKPLFWQEWDKLGEIHENKAVILSPYAKSVTALQDSLWTEIAVDYLEKGYQVYTNVCGDEKPIEGTKELRAQLSEMKSIVEKAGAFIGIRSGLCDVISSANCLKIALYPDYYYSDTRWKAKDIYEIAGFENIVVNDGDTWLRLKNTNGDVV